jgi:hypothetical protein
LQLLAVDDGAEYDIEVANAEELWKSPPKIGLIVKHCGDVGRFEQVYGWPGKHV